MTKTALPVLNQIRFPEPPRGLKSLPWRLPIWIYRGGLGWLFGKKFLLLTHLGRKSAQPRQAVLEIIDHSPSEDLYYVVSGFGTQSQWYQNLLHQPRVQIQVGTKKMPVLAVQLDPVTAGEAIVAYAEKYPANLKFLSRLIGYELEHTPTGYRSFGEQIPVIQFSPRDD